MKRVRLTLPSGNTILSSDPEFAAQLPLSRKMLDVSIAPTTGSGADDLGRLIIAMQDVIIALEARSVGLTVSVDTFDDGGGA